MIPFPPPHPPPPPPPSTFPLTQPPPPSTTFQPPPPPPYHPQFTPIPTTPPAHDLPTALSSLTSLLNLSSSTLHSLPTPLSPYHPPSLLPCPFNPNHRLPPASLFSHSLHCPPSISSHHIQTLIQNLKYPHTLRSSNPFTLDTTTTTTENPVSSHKCEVSGDVNDREIVPVKPSKIAFTSDTTTTTNSVWFYKGGFGGGWDREAVSGRPSEISDLCFSLEPYLDFENNPIFFFYSNCPGVVSFPIKGEDLTPPMLTLPAVLASECANFGKKLMGFPNESIRVIRVLLPSEVYAIRKETDRWTDFPFMYSYRILRVILRLGLSSMECLYTWVVANSVKCYGIMLDLAMRDHILVLCKLCWKAIVKEAIDLASRFYDEEGEGSVLSNQSFNCPVLVQVLMWFTTQISVLYGETNGKLFAINMLKLCICHCALSSCMFTEINDPERGNDDLQEPPECGAWHKSKIENEEMDVSGEIPCKSEIFVSQVAAAVAALHERSMLEEKLKVLRSSPSLPAYQRLMEHAYISSKADEERKKRPNYRALLEHDGLLWHHSRNNQDTNRTKTAEELLAEERDYKRRRMSYRGKKLKRSTTQVMRDIIEEYMEEIRQACATDSPTKGVEEADCSLSSTYRTDNYHMDKADSEKRRLDSSPLSKGRAGAYRKEFHADGNVHSADLRDDYYKNMNKASQSHHRDLVSEKSNGRSSWDRNDYSRRPNQLDDSALSRETTFSQEKRNYFKDSRDNFSRSSSRSYKRSHEKNSSQIERSDRKSDFKRLKARSTSDDFDDRYDPSES